MLCNVAALILYALCFYLQKDKWNEPQPDIGMAIPLTAIGFVLTLIAGFLGWTLVQKHHAGVDPLPEEERQYAYNK